MLLSCYETNSLHFPIVYTLIDNRYDAIKCLKRHEIPKLKKCGRSVQYILPGEHLMHPFSPLEDELEKVPTGHGRNFWVKPRPAIFPDCHSLQPDARTAAIKARFCGKKAGVTSIASESEIIGFLAKTNVPILGKNAINVSC